MFLLRKYNFKHSFGGTRRAIPAVQTICSSVPLAICDTCKKIPNGDYWLHSILARTLCRPCMEKEIYLVTFHSKSTDLKYSQLNILNSFQVYAYLYYKKNLQINFSLVFLYRGLVIVDTIMIIV